MSFFDVSEKRRLLDARKELARSEHFADIDMFDENAFAAALIAAPEAERLALATPLVWIERADARGEVTSATREIRARRALLLEFGTANPTSRTWHYVSDFGSYGPGVVPARLVDVFQARPKAVQDRFVRWFWERPQDGVVAWEAWRALILAGVLEEPDIDSYYLGALAALTPWSMEGGEDAETMTAPIRAWVRADPPVAELARKGYRLPSTRDGEGSHLNARRIRLIEAGVLTPEDIFDVGFVVLTDAPNRNTSVHHRFLIDAVSADPSVLAPRTPPLLRLLVHGQPAEQSWALGKLVALAAVGMPAVASLMRPGLAAVASAGSADAVRAAIAYADAHMSDDARIDVALAALANPKSTQQQLGARALTKRPQADLTGAARAELAILVPGLTPSVRAMVSSWLGPSAPTAGARASEPPAGVVHAPTLSTAVVSLADSGAVADLVASILGSPTDPIDIELALDGMARFRLSQASRVAQADVGRAFTRAADPQVPWVVRDHIAEAIGAWAKGRAPSGNFVVIASPGVQGKQIRYLGTQPTPPPLMKGPKHPKWRIEPCGMWGTGGLTCARAWEAAYVSVRQPGPLLALPTARTGEISPEAFAARIAARGRSAPVLRFDSIGALLRLPLECDDPAVITTLRSSSHPVATAALASWGHAWRVTVAPWLRPVVTARGLTVAGARAEIRSTTWNKHWGKATWESLVIEWDGRPPRTPSVWDPVGSVAWLSGPEGIAVRYLDWLTEGAGALATVSRAPDWRAALMAAPAQVDAVLAASAAVAVRFGLEDRTSVADEAPLLYLLDSLAERGRGAHLYLAAMMIGRSSSARAVAVDLLVSQPELWDGVELGQAMGMLLAGGLQGLGRAATLASSACTAPATARLVAQVCSTVVAGLDDSPHELGAWLEAWEGACDKAGIGVESPEVREALTRFGVGTSKRAAAARRLLALDS